MPCDTVSTAKIRLNAATVDKELLAGVMEKLQFWSWDIAADGQVIIRGGRGMRSDEEVTSLVNRTYAEAVVRSQAKRFGWTVKQNENGTLEISKVSAGGMGKKF